MNILKTDQGIPSLRYATLTGPEARGKQPEGACVSFSKPGRFSSLLRLEFIR